MVDTLKKVYNRTKERYLDEMASKYLRKLTNKNNSNNKKIRVAFIVQMVEIWDKEVDVYNAMNEREEFEVIMLVVPKYNLELKCVELDYRNNYFLENYKCAIRAIDEKGEVINIEDLNIDYAFYQRPYNQCLPKELRSNSLLRKKIKGCYIPYGFVGANVFNEGNCNSDFFRNIFFTFLESEYMKNILSTKYKKNVTRNLQHFEYLGYPALEKYLNFASYEKVNTILWTPRWSYDEKMGGSHFLEYKDCFIDLKETYAEMELIFRPHPLMFEELLSKQLIKKEEVDNFLKLLQDKEIEYDANKQIDEVMKRADVLITDFSSIIIMFFLTGKPIIYCKSQIQLNEIFMEMSEYMYIVENINDIKKYVEMLCGGEDPLRNKREEFIKKKFADFDDSANRIVDRIFLDFCSRIKC